MGGWGGVLIITIYACPSLNSFSSFESPGFIRNVKQPFMCALINGLPEADTDFIQDFSECLLFFRVKYDKVDILFVLAVPICQV